MKAIVKIRPLNEGAVVPFKIYSKDMCYDVVAVSEEEVLLMCGSTDLDSPAR